MIVRDSLDCALAQVFNEFGVTDVGFLCILKTTATGFVNQIDSSERKPSLNLHKFMLPSSHLWLFILASIFKKNFASQHQIDLTTENQ